MARVVRLHELGGPEVLRIEQEAVGEPGPGELRLRMQAIGLNRAEALFRAGRYMEPPRLPARIGYEGAGVVEAVGPGVQGFAIADPVVVIPAFSMNSYGVAAEQAIVPAHAVAKWPPGLSAVEAAAVPMQYLTAYGALNEIADMGLGDAVLIPAASSSVGLAAIQLANAAGALPIALTRGARKKQALLDAGAAHVVVTGEQDVAAEVMRITGAGARIAFDPVVGPGVATLVEALAPGGILILYGMLSGQPAPLPFPAALRKMLTIRGYTLMEITTRPERLARAFAAIGHGLASGRLKPVVARTFPLEQIADAHRFMESNEQIGKIVLTVG
jgi:NADPH:quinone reductase-like Zn-dependent oxidoreductase